MAKQTNQVTLPVSAITLQYVCSVCKDTAQQPLSDIVEVGTAFCPECDRDMDLQDEVIVTTIFQG